MTVQLRRDPFARATLMRELRAHRNPSGSLCCAECGTTGRTLYIYYWEPDSVADRTWWRRDLKAVCCIGCAEAAGQV